MKNIITDDRKQEIKNHCSMVASFTDIFNAYAADLPYLTESLCVDFLRAKMTKKEELCPVCGYVIRQWR